MGTEYDSGNCRNSFRGSGDRNILRRAALSCLPLNRAGAILKIILTAILFTAIFLMVVNARAEALPRGPLDASGNRQEVIGGRPAGCPHAYCGCGLRKYLGIDDVRLNLAANWAKFFPRTHAQPGAAAVRRHHVMLLLSPISQTTWMVRDYNSGGGLSRIHARDIRGFQFVSVNGVSNGLLASASWDHHGSRGINTRSGKAARTRGRHDNGQMGAIANLGTNFGAIQ